MPAALVVPTIFTAVDKISGVIQRMQRSVGGFAGKASIGVNALNKGLNKLLPSLGGLGRQLWQMAQAAIIFGGVAFSFKTILDYEKSLAHLHGLLNTLSESGFKPYQKEVDRVARATQYGAAAVADAFTKISERNIALAKTPESLGAVTQAAITLSRAAKMELVPATDALVNVLFQFGLAGKDSNRVINVLSAGMVRGSSTIENQIEAYKKFAVTARGANLTLEQSQALIQTVAHQVQGSDAGTALRNIILNLERYKQVYKNGRFDIGYALDKTADHLVKLGTEQKQNIFLQDLFGKRQVNVARQILENIPMYERLTKEVTNTSEAQRLSAKNVDNVTDSFKMLVAQYQNYITSNDNTLPGLKRLKDAIRYVTNNLDDILDTITTLIELFIGLKVAIYATQGVIFAFNVGMGVMGAVTGVANIAIGESAVALGAYRIVMLLTGKSLSVLNTGISSTTAEFIAADAAAATFFSSLAAFVIPAALVALPGILAALAIYETGQNHHGLRSKPLKGFTGKSLIPDVVQQSTNTFASKLTEAKTLSGIMQNQKTINNYKFDKLQNTNMMDSIKTDLSDRKMAPTDRSTPMGTVHITVDDPSGIIKSTTTTGSVTGGVPLKMPRVTSTTGNK